MNARSHVVLCFLIPFFFLLITLAQPISGKTIKCHKITIANRSTAPTTCTTQGYCFILTIVKADDTNPQWNQLTQSINAGCDHEMMVANPRWRCSTMEGDPYGREESEYDAVRIFHHRRYEHIMYFKRCCNTVDMCNKKFDMPHYWLYKKRPPLIRDSHYPEAVIAFVMVVFGCCRPLYLLFVNQRLNRDAAAHRNGTLNDINLEKSLIDSGRILPVDQTKQSKSSGRMKIEQLAEVLARLVYIEQAEKELLEMKDRERENTSSSTTEKRGKGKKEEETTERNVKEEQKEKEKRKRALLPPRPTIRALVLNRTSLVSQASGNGHTLNVTVRKSPSLLDSLLLRMVEHGPYAFNFKPLELMELFDKAKDLFALDPMLLKVPAPVNIIGDLRGQYGDLHRWFHIGGWPPKSRYLFLGGIIDDDEPGSLECIALIAALKVCAPQHIFVIRGVAEMFPYLTSMRYEGKRAEAIGGAVSRMCTVLPIAAIVEGKMLAVHSGITPQLKSRQRFKGATRPCSYENMPLVMRKMLFGEPSKKVRMYRTKPGSNGGDLFGSSAVKKICMQLQVDYVIRSRTPLPNGHEIFFDGKLISIWSAPNKLTEIGAILVVDSHGKMQIRCLRSQRHPANPNILGASTLDRPSTVCLGSGQAEPKAAFSIETAAPQPSVKTGESVTKLLTQATNTDKTNVARTYPTQTMTVDEEREKI